MKRDSRRTRPTQARRPRLRREDIVDAARAVFAQRGYANSTLEDVAAHLNAWKGALYYHVQRKVDLLVEIVRVQMKDTADQHQKIAAMKEPPDVKLRLAVRIHMESILSNQTATKICFEDAAELPPHVVHEIRSLMTQMEQSFTRILEEGVKTGLFHGDPTLMVKHVFGVCNWPYRWYSEGGPQTRQEIIESAVDFLFSGISARRPLKSSKNTGTTIRT